ncbi:MAG: hypothetical protein Q8936_21595 [Bacillota bacterium]|nr:hypothetical protein [Bacillota bacterium]
MRKRKKKSNIPRHKRMKRDSRLQAAKSWMDKYNGKNIVHGYSNHFGVSKLHAVKELQLLGINISLDYIEQLKRSEEELRKAKMARKYKMKQYNEGKTELESDERFYYIAGYTKGGSPYGLTWEEMELDLTNDYIIDNENDSYDVIDDEELPF